MVIRKAASPGNTLRAAGGLENDSLEIRQSNLEYEKNAGLMPRVAGKFSFSRHLTSDHLLQYPKLLGTPFLSSLLCHGWPVGSLPVEQSSVEPRLCEPTDEEFIKSEMPV